MEITPDSIRFENGTSRMRTGWQNSGPNQVDAVAGVGGDGEVRSVQRSSGGAGD